MASTPTSVFLSLQKYPSATPHGDMVYVNGHLCLIPSVKILKS